MNAQISMRRKPILYIINFLLPVLFFLALDLASFLISDSGGEKLSFKVTVMLAVTVLQLILNEILPSSSNSIPLIGIQVSFAEHPEITYAVQIQHCTFQCNISCEIKRLNFFSERLEQINCISIHFNEEP